MRDRARRMSQTAVRANPLLRLGRLVQELRDPWAIFLVEVTALGAYLFAAAPVWQAIGAGVVVLLVRVVAGLALPVPGYRFDPLSVLTRREYEIAIFVCQGLSHRRIGERLNLTERTVQQRVARIMRKLGIADQDQLVDLVREYRADEPAAPKPWYERSIVRGTLAAAGFIGFGWTGFQILCRFFGCP